MSLEAGMKVCGTENRKECKDRTEKQVICCLTVQFRRTVRKNLNFNLPCVSVLVGSVKPYHDCDAKGFFLKKLFEVCLSYSEVNDLKIPKQSQQHRFHSKLLQSFTISMMPLLWNPKAFKSLMLPIST